MNVKWLLGFRGVARSLRKDICIFAPGSCIPECHAKAGCRSRNNAVGRVDLDGNSLRAMAIAREAGPKPMHMRSRGASWRDAVLLLQISISSELNFAATKSLIGWLGSGLTRVGRMLWNQDSRGFWNDWGRGKLLVWASQSFFNNLQPACIHWIWHDCNSESEVDQTKVSARCGAQINAWKFLKERFSAIYSSTEW